MIRRFALRSRAQPSQAWSDDPVPCSSTSGLASSRGPSSRRCTFMPATSTKTDGGGAKRPCSSATVRSGAQFTATKTPMSNTGVSATHRITMKMVFMASCRDWSSPPCGSHGARIRRSFLPPKRHAAQLDLVHPSVVAAINVHGAADRSDGFLGELEVGDLIECQLLIGRDVADIDAVLMRPLGAFAHEPGIDRQ